MDTAGAEIFWFVDGTELTGARNERSIKVVVGKFGKTTEVRARVKTFEGLGFTLERSIPSTLVDLIIEPQTYVLGVSVGRMVRLGVK